MNIKTSFDYVCPVCFQQIQNCKCDIAPNTLIMIDQKIQWAIQQLNYKGQRTQACCAGHYNFKEASVIYIYFLYKPKDAPKNWEIKNNGIYYICFPKNKNEFDLIQNKAFNSLKHWIK